MSISGFHHHFKVITAMSPLEFQKQLRLEGLLAGDIDAATAGYRVGYDDPSHFSREYKRLFGESPRRDVERLRAAAASSLTAPVRALCRDRSATLAGIRADAAADSCKLPS